MEAIPRFRLFGEGDPAIEESIQPSLTLRQWSDLTSEEKLIAVHDLENRGWLERYCPQIVATIVYLNTRYLRLCPGESFHKLPRGTREHEQQDAALKDFRRILLHEKTEALVYRMISYWLKTHINRFDYDVAARTADETERKKLIDRAYLKFDRLANCLNHIFDQFSINHMVTRGGLVPRQDERITDTVYRPALQVLADPKWRSVSADLAEMFADYREGQYPETITKGHRAVQRFLQILVGEEGHSGKGEVAKLFAEAKRKGLIRADTYTERIISALQSHIVSARANRSTAKPALETAMPSDALLMMNVVMVLLQHCLQNIEM